MLISDLLRTQNLVFSTQISKKSPPWEGDTPSHTPPLCGVPYSITQKRAALLTSPPPPCEANMQKNVVPPQTEMVPYAYAHCTHTQTHAHAHTHTHTHTHTHQWACVWCMCGVFVHVLLSTHIHTYILTHTSQFECDIKLIQNLMCVYVCMCGGLFMRVCLYVCY